MSEHGLMGFVLMHGGLDGRSRALLKQGGTETSSGGKSKYGLPFDSTAFFPAREPSLPLIVAFRDKKKKLLIAFGKS